MTANEKDFHTHLSTSFYSHHKSLWHPAKNTEYGLISSQQKIDESNKTRTYLKWEGVKENSILIIRIWNGDGRKKQLSHDKTDVFVVTKFDELYSRDIKKEGIGCSLFQYARYVLNFSNEIHCLCLIVGLFQVSWEKFIMT